MPEKNLASSIATSLVPLGAIALAAGCGGGGTSVAPPMTPQNNSANTGQQLTGATGPTVTAQLSVTIPARGAQALKRATPQYISPGSGAIGVKVAGSTEQAFTLPTPGPAPVTTTLPVKAVVGTDTIAVNIYDVSPAATASPKLLSTGSITSVISPTALNTPSVTALGVPAGVVFALANNAVPAPSATQRPWTPLEHATTAQSVTINTTAIDALGYTITGALATAAPIIATGPVTLSAPSVTTATSTITATYPQGSTAVGTIDSTLPLTSGTVAVTPDYGIFLSGTNLSVIDGVDRTLTTVATAIAGANVAATSCAGGAVAVAPVAGQVEIATLAGSTPAHPVPAVTLSTFAVSGLTATSPVVFDAACNAYVAVPLGSAPFIGYTIEKLSGFGGTVQSATVGSPVVAVNGTVQTVRMSIAGTTLYMGQGGTNSSAPFASGQTVTYQLPNTGPVFLDGHIDESVAVSGATIYKTWNTAGTSTPCNYAGPDLQDLQASQGTLSGTSVFSNPVQPLVAASDGMLYAVENGFGGSAFVATPPLTTGTWTALSNVTTPQAFALSPDPANTFFIDYTGLQINIYNRLALGTVQTPATVLISSSVTSLAAAP